MSYYLGIDASLTSPGFCVAGGISPYISSSNYKSKKTGFERIVDIHDEVVNYLSGFPVKIIMEELPAGSKGSYTIERAELVGVIKSTIYRMNLWGKFFLVNPSTLKKFATGKGNCDKPAMILQAYKEFGIEFVCNDECDAFWLVQIGRALDGHWDGLNRTKLREGIVEKLKGA
ncbi:MAG TPA: crossover junction endodeoxyribonuclease RuvC [Desulfitobacterium dehalogenans]|uniref:Crossover junction endodeoxyribonuclease RuvC n=1 Tax=Desulfitobacterium dehalogenans TaxID=36854 RepID=A0A7C6Z4V3_9FIRM|nr:crossover junction endodeoxyribonuclease RuvC [Desulfitobacterium dehalogenans]